MYNQLRNGMVCETEGLMTNQYIARINENNNAHSLEAREMEQAFLWEFSNEVVLIKDRENLLLTLHSKIRELISFNDIIITLYNHHLKTHAAFLYYSEDKRRLHPDFEEARYAHSSIAYGVVNRTMERDNPVFFQLADLMEKPDAHVYVKFYSKSGIEEFVGVSMRNKNGIFGGLYLFSENKHTYHPRQYNMIKAIGNQISNAVANILAHDELIRKEAEKTMLLALSNEISSIREKERMLQVFLRHLNTIFHFAHAAIRVDDTCETVFYAYRYDTR